VSRIITPRRSLVLPSRFRQQQGGFIINPFAHGAGPSTSHRHWSILITANDGSASYMGFTEVELRSTVGGADFTVPQANDSAAARATDRVNTSNTWEKACDNNTATTGWLSNGVSGSKRWRYDCGDAGHTGNATEVVRQVVIRGSHNAPTASPKDFLIQWSDDPNSSPTNWTTVLTVTGQTGWTGSSDARTFNVP